MLTVTIIMGFSVRFPTVKDGFIKIHTICENISNRYISSRTQITISRCRDVQVLESRHYKGRSEIDEVFGVVSKIIFGPNFGWEMSNSSEDKLVMKITRCPLLKDVKGKGRDPEELSETCQAYCRSAVENLNPKYTQRYAKRMCTGDNCCENVISIRE